VLTSTELFNRNEHVHVHVHELLSRSVSGVESEEAIWINRSTLIDYNLINAEGRVKRRYN
jgi:hypothetical protein